MAEITECIECAVCGSVGRLISENTEVSGGTLTYICPRCQPSYDCEVRPNGLLTTPRAKGTGPRAPPLITTKGNHDDL